MKLLAHFVLVLCCWCWIAGCANTQQDTHVAFVTNAMDINGAIALASHLSYQMPESNAVAYLKQHGLTKMASGGDSFSWNDSFSLSNRCSLALVIVPKPLSPDGAWINGRLWDVRIYNSSGDSEPIALIEQTTASITNGDKAP